MYKISIIIIMLMGCSACVPPVEIQFPNSIYISDSDADPDFDPANQSGAYLAGIPVDAKAGRSLMDYGDTLPNKNPIFLALGKNDRGTDINDYTNKLQTLLDSTDNDVYCVLPSIPDNSLDAIRAAMSATCTLTIDTEDYITQFTDGIHYGDQAAFGVKLKQIANQY